MYFPYSLLNKIAFTITTSKFVYSNMMPNNCRHNNEFQNLNIDCFIPIYNGTISNKHKGSNTTGKPHKPFNNNIMKLKN